VYFLGLWHGDGVLGYQRQNLLMFVSSFRGCFSAEALFLGSSKEIHSCGIPLLGHHAWIGWFIFIEFVEPGEVALDTPRKGGASAGCLQPTVCSPLSDYEYDTGQGCKFASCEECDFETK